MNHPKNEPDLVEAGVKWPMTLNDPAVAIHETIEHGNCEAHNPMNCFSVSHRTILATLEHYQQWLKHRGVDVDELLASRRVSSKEVGR